MNCVVCSTTMETVQHEGVTLDVCPSGHGTWCDADELGVVARTHPASTQGQEATALAADGTTQTPSTAPVPPPTEVAKSDPRACPVCEQPMQQLIYAYESGITIDSCPDHGVWLDAGELEAVEAWFEDQERTAHLEEPQWTTKLRQVASDEDQRLDNAVAAVHWGPFAFFARHSSSLKPAAPAAGHDRLLIDIH